MNLPVSLICLIFVAISIGWSSGDKIFDGRLEVEPGTRPWLVWLQIGRRRVGCGGALINPRYVLTAASCTLQTITAVVLGDYSRSTNEGTEQRITVRDIFVHPDYNSTSNEADIAVLELVTAADVSGPNVTVIPVLPKDRLTTRIFTKHCRLDGWGYTVRRDEPDLDNQSDIPLEYTADVANDTFCNAAGIPPNAVCFLPYRDPQTSATCEGDVGGPMIAKRKRVWHAIGVISGFNTDQTCSAGVKSATRVPEYLNFINQFV